MSKLRCIVIGSSMAMPSNDLGYEKTWLYKLIKKYPSVEFIDKNTRSSSVRRLVKEGALNNGYDLLEYYSPDFVIMQIGISDCSPRLLKREALSTKFINTLPFSKLIYDFVRKTKGRTISCCDINTETFYNCLAAYAERAKNNGVRLFCIKIAYTGDCVVKKSPHMIESINLYNKEFDKLAACFDNVSVINPLPDFESIEDLFLSDGIHLNEKGTDIVFQNIVSAIDSFIISKNAYDCNQ